VVGDCSGTVVVPPTNAVTPPPAKTAPAPLPPPAPVTPKAPPAPGFSAAANTARVVVHVDTQSNLWVNDVKCPLEGTTRSFDTPPLEAGHQYYYTLSVELPQGGREDRRVALVPGRTTEVDFRPLAAARIGASR